MVALVGATTARASAELASRRWQRAGRSREEAPKRNKWLNQVEKLKLKHGKLQENSGNLVVLGNTDSDSRLGEEMGKS